MNRNLTLIKILILITVVLSIEVKLATPAEGRCPTIKLANGRPKFQRGGRLVRFRCLKGYEFVGRRYMNCFRGQWDFQRDSSMNMPMCVKPGCRASSYVNGHFLETYKGAVVNVVCNLGYTLIGASSTVYCNGTDWNVPFPECKAINPTPPKFCDFESSLCGWTQDPIGDWIWKNATRLPQTLEDFLSGEEHSDLRYQTGNFGGHMLLGDSSSRIANATERLFSPVFPREYSNDSCFTFWYLLRGETAGYLKVFVKEEGAELYNTIPLFWVTGDQSSKWQYGYFALYETETPFQIIFEGMSLPGNESETAFDDVKIQSGSACERAKQLFDSLQPPTSTTTEASFDDEGSCRNRCGPQFRDKQDKCDCQDSCSTFQTCCSDYEAFCLLTETSSPSTVADQTNESETFSSTTMGDKTHKAINQGAQLAAHNQGNSTTRSITVGFGSTITPSQQNKHILVNIKTIVELKPFVQRVNTTSTTSSPITNATTTTTTPSTTISTTAKRSTFTTASRRYNHNYLPLDPARMKSILHEVRVSGDVRESGDNSPQLMKSESDQQMAPQRFIIWAGEVITGVTVFLVCTAVAVALIRRRRRQRTKAESMVEDSDVRFLTADEFLDFTLARPADDDL